MNLDELLKNILDISGYPEEKKEEFISTFYQYFFTQLFAEIAKVDYQAAEKLIEASKTSQQTPQSLVNAWGELVKNPKLSAIVEKVTNEVFGQLADDINKYASAEQKQKITSILAGYNA